MKTWPGQCFELLRVASGRATPPSNSSAFWRPSSRRTRRKRFPAARQTSPLIVVRRRAWNHQTWDQFRIKSYGFGEPPFLETTKYAKYRVWVQTTGCNWCVTVVESIWTPFLCGGIGIPLDMFLLRIPYFLLWELPEICSINTRPKSTSSSNGAVRSIVFH